MGLSVSKICWLCELVLVMIEKPVQLPMCLIYSLPIQQQHQLSYRANKDSLEEIRHCTDSKCFRYVGLLLSVFCSVL